MADQLSFSATHLYVIDGMPDGPDRTAHDLIDGIHRRLHDAPRALVTRLIRVSRLADVFEALGEIEEIARKGALPMLHLDGHADPTGFRTSLGEIVIWDRLWSALRRINIACKNNLTVTAGACQALHAILSKEFDLMQESPVFVFIAPQMIVAGDTVEVGFELYYECLFRSGDVSTAFEQLVEIDRSSGAEVGDFQLVAAQQLFENSAAGYIVKHCMGIGARRRYTRLVRDMKADGKNSTKGRARLREMLRGSQASALKGYHERFMLIDRFPELQSRLGMDYLRFECWVRHSVKSN